MLNAKTIVFEGNCPTMFFFFEDSNSTSYYAEFGMGRTEMIKVKRGSTGYNNISNGLWHYYTGENSGFDYTIPISFYD